MATSRIQISAPASAVYETLMDAWTYETWVRGTKKIRDVEAEWPAEGSRFHHTVGLGPVALRDNTKLLRAEPDRLVELEVRLWPGGTGVVRLELEAVDDRTNLTMHEHPMQGPVAAFDNPVQQRVIRFRNDFSLRKLKKIVEQRWRMRR